MALLPALTLSDWLTTATAYSTAAADGVTIAANNVALSNINIDGFYNGVRFASDVSNTALTNVDVSNSDIGIEKSIDADINGLTITGGSFVDGYIGIDFAKDTAVGQAGNGLATNVTISGTHFQDMTAKGIYVEALSNALITGVSMDHVGFYGAGPAFGGPDARCRCRHRGQPEERRLSRRHHHRLRSDRYRRSTRHRAARQRGRDLGQDP